MNTKSIKNGTQIKIKQYTQHRMRAVVAIQIRFYGDRWCPEEASNLGKNLLNILVNMDFPCKFGTKLFPNLVRN